MPSQAGGVNLCAMGLFEFILIIVVVSALGKAAMAIGGPLADHLGDFLRETAAEKRARREALESGAMPGADVLEELELRLGRIEDRLDFLEELRAPPDRRALHGTGSPSLRAESDAMGGDERRASGGGS